MFLRLLLILFLAGTGAWADALRVAVISDLNGSYGSTDYGPDVDRAIARIVQMRPDLVISTGDMVAGQQVDPHLDQARIAAMWQAFNAHVTEPLESAGIPLLVTPGNHDASGYPGFEDERRAYDRNWTAHSPDVEILDGERYPFRYAASVGGVLFVSLDVTMPGKLPVEEMEWLDHVLKQEAPRHRATVVFGHLPALPISVGRETEVIGDPGFVEMLARHHVTAYLSGHHQAYYAGVAQGVLMVGQACLGGGPRKLLGQDKVSPKGFTMVEIAEDGSVKQAALAGPDFDHAIPLESLPGSIGSLVRADLAGR